MNNIFFILSHQDDEFGVFESIYKSIQKKNKIYIFYMTNGEIGRYIDKNKFSRRDKESLKVLKKLGIRKQNIIFFGRKNNIPTCCLFKNLNKAYKILDQFFTKIGGNLTIYTHAYEGGNEDHDACNILISKLLKNNKNIKFAYQFPLYHAFSFFYYKVQNALKINGKIIYVKSNFLQRIKFISYLFYYKSQFKVWIGLYPFLISNLLLRNYFILQKMNKNFIIRRPHRGKLLYEKFRNVSFSDLKLRFDRFLNN